MAIPPSDPRLRRLRGYFNQPAAGCGVLYMVLEFMLLASLCWLAFTVAAL